MSYTVKNIYKNFTLFSLGFFVYLLIEFGFRGYTFFISGLMGGIATVMIDKFNDYILCDIDLNIQCILYLCVICFFVLFRINFWHIRSAIFTFEYVGLF